MKYFSHIIHFRTIHRMQDDQRNDRMSTKQIIFVLIYFVKQYKRETYFLKTFLHSLECWVESKLGFSWRAVGNLICHDGNWRRYVCVTFKRCIKKWFWMIHTFWRCWYNMERPIEIQRLDILSQYFGKWLIVVFWNFQIF